MHVVEPKTLENRKAERTKAKQVRRRFVALLFLTLFVAGSYLAWWKLWPLAKDRYRSVVSSNGQSGVEEESAQSVLPEEKKKTTLKQFKGDDFRDLYRAVNYPNVAFFEESPEITGNIEADAKIRELAEARGFVLTSMPVSPIQKTGEPLLEGSEDDLLQPLALNAWKELKQEATAANIPLQLVSAYRSVSRQRELFVERLLGTGVTVEQVAGGLGDAFVNETLSLTAVPGYSRHHTGYTIDLFCDDGYGSFDGSSCDTWLKSNNYEVAKKHGWIPSYPEDASEQGPEPEAWEYVWVGTDHLYE